MRLHSLLHLALNRTTAIKSIIHLLCCIYSHIYEGEVHRKVLNSCYLEHISKCITEIYTYLDLINVKWLMATKRYGCVIYL